MMSRKQEWWLKSHGFDPRKFRGMTQAEIFQITQPKTSPADLLRCGRCSYVFKRSELTSGLCHKCSTLKKYQNDPTWQSLKLMRDSINYLLSCNPEDICRSKFAADIIELGDSRVWKTVPKK